MYFSAHYGYYLIPKNNRYNITAGVNVKELRSVIEGNGLSPFLFHLRAQKRKKNEEKRKYYIFTVYSRYNQLRTDHF